MSKATYTIKKGENGAEDIVVSSGKPHEFKMSDVTTHLRELLRGEKESKAQIELESAKMTNIVEHNPFINDLTDEQKHAVYLYFSAKNVRDQFQQHLNNVQAALAEYSEDVEDIRSQTGIAFEMPVLTEVKPQEQAAA